MKKGNYILDTINEIKKVLGKNDYRIKRYNKDLEWFEDRKNIFKDNIIRVAIMGITSSGKSTLVNALLGEKILPMAIRPSSSIIITACKGENRQATIYFKDKKSQILEGSNLNEEIIRQYADESKNPNNRLNVTQIDIKTPYFLLDENIHIIDSPGLDAWNLDNHEKLTLEILLPTIDICIFLTTVKATSDEANVEKIKIVDEKEKQIILVQNMIDSIEEKLGRNGIVEEDKSIILKKHKKRAENLLMQGTKKSESFEVIQISALNGLKGIINKDKELYESSNIQDFIRAIETCVNSITPRINEKRSGSLEERINQIITTDKEIINGNDVDTIEALKNVKVRDINGFAEEFQNAQEKILLKIKEIEAVISDTIFEIRNSSSEELQSYLDIVDRINNKNLYIESDILNIVKECEKRKNEIYEKLNLDTGFEYFLQGIESKNLDVKHKYEEKTILFKKEGVLNKGKRLFSNIFDREWGYTEVEYDEKVVDKEATIDIAQEVCNQNNIEYLNILKEWSTEYNKAINVFYEEVGKRAEEYEEKKKQNIELYDIEDANKNLKSFIDKLIKLKAYEENKLETTIDGEKYEAPESISYSIPKVQYNIYKLSTQIFEKNYLLLWNYIKERSIEKIKEETKEIFWIWDIDSCAEFVSRVLGIHLSQQQCEVIKQEGIYSFDKIVIVYDLCKNTLGFYSALKKIKDKSYNMFIVFNGIQIGNSKKLILESRSLNYFITNNNLMINLVIDSWKVFINSNNIKELLMEVHSLKNSIINKFNNSKDGYILINSKNPIYNMALIEGQEKDKFIISDYRDIKEILFGNPLSRGEEEKETLEEILSYFLNKEHDTI
ncbi:hypothetical protein psyc5s11_14550 [Clostridium gelidum]|uniref:Dynamin N-terminal domain-containing protein n=1 Tax=Clostridium gelidum TaxID=704125 RepID=A0ABM7T2J6_9CLOT|nr:dynamin family protein [Clostridium gelidum]BCZ45388.1 hypothetical protein psyc5s11_14550 [Clostridium gelidum]